MKLGFLKEDGCDTIVVGRERLHADAFDPAMTALAFASVTQAIVTALGVIIATISAGAIQLWFRVQAKRSQFRRRQTSSRLATFAEAFCSIGWAATAALAACKNPWATSWVRASARTSA